jgi:AcrR family transcriptional regulator
MEHKTKAALEKAFRELLHEKGYDAISITDITSRANVGRSSFYRYFENKADLLLSLHEMIFQRLMNGLNCPEDWLSEEPSSALIAFFTQLEHHARFQPFLYSFGKDLEYVMRRLDHQLAMQFEASLKGSFNESRIPFPVLAHSVAGVYTWIFRLWLTTRASYSAQEIATYAHQMARAIVQTSV